MTSSSMMLPQPVFSANLGFRPPQFSDDPTWLPAWLQPHVATTPLDDEDGEDLQNHFGLSAEDVGQARGAGFQDGDPNCLPDNRLGNIALQLNLSGDDDSHGSETPSCENALHFSLHVSTDGSSDSPYYPTTDTALDGRLNSAELLVKASRETGAGKQCAVESSLDSLELFSSSCCKNRPTEPLNQTQSSDRNTEKSCIRKLDNDDSENDEVNDAIELSTSAAEALVMYELIQSELSSDALSSAAILELALRVKQTRSQWLDNSCTLSSTNDSSNSSDVLLDLGDSDMEDAYDDVGLSLTNGGISGRGMSVSQVAETPMSTINEQPNAVTYDEPMMHQLHRTNSDDIEVQKSDEDSIKGVKCKRIRHIKRNVIETSDLSESANVASDMNSCVRNNDGLLKASQSSIHMERLYRIEGSEPLQCQDYAKETSSSFVDPLCSVVPCSISAQPHDSLSYHSCGNRKQNLEESITPQASLEVQMMHTFLSSKDEIVCQKVPEKATANALDPCLLNRRHKASPNVYGLRSPGHRPLIQKNSSIILGLQAENAMDIMSATRRQNNTSLRSLQNVHDGGVANDGVELQVGLNNKEPAPLILSHGARRRVQVHRNHITDNSTEIEKPDLQGNSSSRLDPSGVLEDSHIQHGEFPDTSAPARKRVRFTIDDDDLDKKKASLEQSFKYKSRKLSSRGKKKQPSDQWHCWSSQEVKEHLTNSRSGPRKKPIFLGLDFLLTGFPSKKEKEVERTLRRYGGVVLADIPAVPNRNGRNARSDSVQLPVVICTKKVQTMKFLYGCAVNAFLLRLDWVTDSIKAGSVLQPGKYMVLPDQPNRWTRTIQKPIHQGTVERIFHKVGVMLHGERSIGFELAEVIKHGQGRVYKTLQRLVQSLKNKNISVAFIITEDETHASRHLRKCASEQKIPVKSTSWIVNSIFNGKLLPFEENSPSSHHPPVEVQVVSASQEWTQEI